MVVYLIKNKNNGKGYVGATVQPIRARWNAHKTVAFTGRSVVPLSLAILKHGSDAWDMEVLEVCDTVEQMYEREKAWIAGLGTHVSTGDGYNVSPGGAGGQIGSRRSEESRARMSETHRRIGSRPPSRKWCTPAPISELTREKMRARGKAQTHSPLSVEAKAKLSVANKGKKLSEEHKAKLRKPKSATTKAKMKAAWVKRRGGGT